MKLFYYIMLAQFSVLMISSCTSITIDSPRPAELCLGRGAQVSIIPEYGSDCQALANTMSQLFADNGFYQLVDRSNLNTSMNERAFQRMSFVENRSFGRIKGADAFIHLRAGASSTNSNEYSSSNYKGEVYSSFVSKTTVRYEASYRTIIASSSQVAGSRQIDLSASASNYSSDSYPAPPDPNNVLVGLRNQVANEIFTKLHPTVLRIKRPIGKIKSTSAKEAIRLANAGLWNEAIAAARKGIEESPQEAEALYVLAITYQGAMKYQEADEILHKLILISSASKYLNAIKENKEVWQNANQFKQQM